MESSASCPTVANAMTSRKASGSIPSQLECARPSVSLSSSNERLWREPLQAMDALRESVGLRGLTGQKILIEYKNEATTCSPT